MNDQVTSLSGNIESIDFNYDLNANRLTDDRTNNNIYAGDTIYAYQGNSNRILGVDRIRTDTNTNTNTVPPSLNRSLVYNDVGRLYQVFDQGNLIAQYIYNDDGQRTRKTTYENNLPLETTIYHYSGQGLLITETDEDGNLKRDYIWSEQGQPLAQVDVDNENNPTSAEQITYLHNDHLLTNRLATNQNQTIVWRWEGEAFGNTQAEEDPDGDGQATVINLRFPGQYRDEETNLFYNWYRYYDPQLGRYITSDPIGLDGGINTYGYANQNPLYWIDPRGLNANEDMMGLNLRLDQTLEGGAGGIGGFGGSTRSSKPFPFATQKVKGPKFPNLKDHAHRHEKFFQGTNQYYNSAVKNISTGKSFQFRRNGEQRMCYLTRTGQDSFTFTSTSMSGKVIYTQCMDSSTLSD